MERLRLTVAMAVYNAMPYLPDAVGSILGQTFGEFELVAVDDGSTDESLEYLRSVKDARLRVLQTGGRRGQGAARNMVIRECATEYLAFADADDVSLPERFARQIARMDERPEIGMLGSLFAYMGPSGRTGMTPALALEHKAIRRDLMDLRHAVANCTLMFRMDAFARAGAFRIDGAGEDWDLFLRMTEHTRVANLAEVLVCYRLHAGSTNAEQAQMLMDRYGHACECARLREQGLAETEFEEFRERQRRRPWWARRAERLHMMSGRQYRRAVVEILEGATMAGYARLAVAGVLSPARVVQRVSRILRGR